MTPLIKDLLLSENPADRQRAAYMLAQTGNPAALRILALINKNDPDSIVRYTAMDAGRHLKEALAAAAGEALPEDTESPFSAQDESSSLDLEMLRLLDPEAVYNRRDESSDARRTVSEDSEKLAQQMLRLLDPESNRPERRRTVETPSAKKPTGQLTQETPAAKKPTGQLTQETPPTEAPAPPAAEGPKTKAARTSIEARRITGEVPAIPPTSKKPTGNLGDPTPTEKRRTGEMSALPLKSETKPRRPGTGQLKVGTGQLKPSKLTPVYVEVSLYDQDRAHGFVVAAKQQYDMARFVPALEYLRRALEIDPNLRYDEDFIDVAKRYTDLPEEEAIERILDPKGLKQREIDRQQWRDSQAQKPKKKDREYLGEPTWEEVMMSLGIYTLITTAVRVIGLLFIAFAHRDSLAQARTMLEKMPEVINTSGTAGSVIYTYATLFTNPFIIIGFALGFAVAMLIGVLIDYVIIHLVTTIAFAGHGTLKNLITKLNWFLILTDVATTLVIIATLFIAVQKGSADLASGKLIATVPFEALTASYMSIGSIQCVLIAGQFLAFVWMCVKISEVYGCSIVQGCGCLILLLIFSGAIYVTQIQPVLERAMRTAN